VTGAYGDTEIDDAITVAYIYEEAVRAGGKSSLWAEVRQWKDRLGLTMKGKRDLRLRTIEDAPAEEATSERKPRPRLRLVDDAVAS
jgi:hypothetical protein